MSSLYVLIFLLLLNPLLVCGLTQAVGMQEDVVSEEDVG